jgi:site-specific DNA-methyltransferase (adenine-specific)
MSGDIYHGDCLEDMKLLPANHVDTIITDPPYGLSFMGKEWDKGVPGVPFWAEMLRVCKPGAMLLAFGGTRTYHRMTCAIEDAGWELRDCMMWLYGSGFPKSLDISKAIDKLKGAERKRELVPTKKGNLPEQAGPIALGASGMTDISEPITDLAHEWSGWGTALKPAWEPIIVAMKPIEGTFAENAEKWGVAGLNVDGGRIDAPGKKTPLTRAYSKGQFGGTQGKGVEGMVTTPVVAKEGRWPANLILDEEAGAMLGEPSRFFYCAKASKSERNAGCEGMEAKETPQKYGLADDGVHSEHKNTPRSNHHPTVKPLKLMEYLCTLTKTPTGGIVLDPFAGSGTTGVACANTGRKYILIEKEQAYIDIILARLEGK